MKNKQFLWRTFFYIFGNTLTGIGLAFVAKCGMGISSGVATSHSISTRFGTDLSRTLFCYYLMMIGIQLLLKRKNFRKRDVLQIPCSYAHSWLTGWFIVFLSDFSPQTLPQKFLFLIIGFVMLGCGCGMCIPMRMVPTPMDGVVEALHDVTGIKSSLCKNLVDFSNMSLAIVCDLVLFGEVIHIGLGTVINMLMIGRVMALFLRVFGPTVLRLSGMKDM